MASAVPTFFMAHIVPFGSSEPPSISRHLFGMHPGLGGGERDSPLKTTRLYDAEILVSLDKCYTRLPPIVLYQDKQNIHCAAS